MKTYYIHGREYRSLDEVRDRLDDLSAAHPGGRFPKAIEAEVSGLAATLSEATREARTARLAELARDPRNHEDGDGARAAAPQRPAATAPGDENRSAALREVERHVNDGTLDSRSADNIDDTLKRDRDGLDARYIAAVSSDHYARAFGKVLTRPQTAQYEMTPEEAQALRAVAEITEARSMVIGTNSAGGYGLPIAIDPTMRLTSDGVLNPLREVATVRSITTSEWRGVTTAGVTASFGAESSEVADGTPTLAQPKIIPERATAFVPFSFEIGQDYPALQEELRKLFSDAKDNLEADKFANGAGHGSNEPQGIVPGTTNTVDAATGLTMTLSNLYALQAALPPRFEPRARMLANNSIFLRVRQFDTVGSPSLVWATSLQDGMPSRLLDYPAHRLSTMTGTITNNAKILIFGDIAAGFEIADRIGMSVELVQHLFGTNKRPTGERGLLAWWRTSSGVVNTNALRALIGKT